MGRLGFAPIAVMVLVCTLAAFSQGVGGQRSIQVSGSVVDAYGRPVPAAMVQFQSTVDGIMHTAVTDGFGQFTFEVNEPGPYQATITTALGTEQMTVRDQIPVAIVIRLKPGLSTTRTNAAAVSPTVSLNDLEAPGKAKSKLAGAEKAIGKSDFSKAWKLINEAIRIAPNWGKAYLFRGALSFTQHDYASARSDFASALARTPHDAIALTEMGKLDTTTGNLHSAQLYLQQALQRPPVQWPTYLEAARLDLLQHNYAVAAHMAALAMQCTPPPPPGIHFIAGQAEYYLHHYTRSAQQFKLFLAQAPKTAAFAQARANAQQDLEIVSQRTRTNATVH